MKKSQVYLLIILIALPLFPIFANTGSGCTNPDDINYDVNATSEDCYSCSGYALNLTNNTVYANVPHNTALNPSSITVMAYITPNSIDNVTFTSSPFENSIVAKEGQNNQGYAFRIGDGGDLSFVFGVNGGWPEATTNNDPIVAGTTYHVAGTFDGSTIRIYIDGALVGTQTTSGAYTASTNSLFIGESPAFANRFFDGIIDEISIWNYAKTATEIANEVNIPYAGNETGLLAYYTFNTGLNSGIAVDSSPNQFDGTFVNNTGIICDDNLLLLACPSYTYVTDIYFGAIQTGVYFADDVLESDGTVAYFSVGTVVFQAGDQFIELQNDFTVTGENDFIAEIVDCDLNN